MPHPRVRVVAVDDEPLILEFVKEHLERDPRIEVVGTGCNGREALQLTNRLRPDVVVLDVSMPVLNGIEAAARITASFPSIGVLMLTAHQSLDSMKTAIRAGAREYLSKDTEMERLGDAICSVAAKRPESTGERGPGFIWSFYGTKGGAGCTTLAVNTAVALARLRYKVVLVDLDLLHGDCGFFLDMSPRPTADVLLANLETLADVDATHVEDGARAWPAGAADGLKLDVLESPTAVIPHGTNCEQHLTDLMELLARLYDYVVVDLPPGRLFEPIAAPLVDLSERVFLVHSQDMASLRGLLVLTNLLERCSVSGSKLTLLFGTLNGVQHEYREYLARTLELVKDVQDVPVDREACREALRVGRPALVHDEGSPFSTFVNGLVERALNLPPRAPEKTGLLERIKEFLRGSR